MIDKFDDDYGFLSNFAYALVEYDGLMFTSSENAFQAAKCLIKEKRQLFLNIEPNKAKSLGRAVKIRGDWDIVKDSIMYEIVKEKFVRNKHLKTLLLGTEDHILKEGNWWHDNYWGDCSCDKCKNIIGKNKLGKILMKVRKELKDS